MSKAAKAAIATREVTDATEVAAKAALTDAESATGNREHNT